MEKTSGQKKGTATRTCPATSNTSDARDTPATSVSPVTASGMSIARSLAHFMAEAFLETMWPTRCAVCDEPGALLCDRCRSNLPYIDWWRACPRCGAPYGRVLCSECNPIMLSTLKRQEPPFTAAASAVSYESAARRIVSIYKDRGERRLADTMAQVMTPYIAPAWRAQAQAVVFVPATAVACRRRGFDHAELLAQLIAERIGLPCINMLQRPRSTDQRKLSRHGRLANMQGRFTALPETTPLPSVLLVDDVCTTGATLFAAVDALRESGTDHVYCLTFARAW